MLFWIVWTCLVRPSLLKKHALDHCYWFFRHGNVNRDKKNNRMAYRCKALNLFKSSAVETLCNNPCFWKADRNKLIRLPAGVVACYNPFYVLPQLGCHYFSQQCFEVNLNKTILNPPLKRLSHEAQLTGDTEPGVSLWKPGKGGWLQMDVG